MLEKKFIRAKAEMIAKLCKTIKVLISKVTTYDFYPGFDCGFLVIKFPIEGREKMVGFEGTFKEFCQFIKIKDRVVILNNLSN